MSARSSTRWKQATSPRSTRSLQGESSSRSLRAKRTRSERCAAGDNNIYIVDRRLEGAVSRWRAVFRGAGGLRAGWRLLLFAAAATILMSGLPWIAVKAGWKPRAGFDPADFLMADGLGLVALVLAARLMAAIERVRPSVYGLGFQAGFLRRLAEGIAWGSGTALAVAAAM